jgi:transposase-like protein
MSKHRVVVLKIIAKQLTVTEAAEKYGLSRRQLHRLLARYRDEGLDAVEPRSRPDQLHAALFALRRAGVPVPHGRAPRHGVVPASTRRGSMGMRNRTA